MSSGAERAGSPLGSNRRTIACWLCESGSVTVARNVASSGTRTKYRCTDPGATLRKLMQERDPIYALADLTVQSRDVLHDKIVDEIVNALAGQLGVAGAAGAAGAPEPGDRRS